MGVTRSTNEFATPRQVWFTWLVTETATAPDPALPALPACDDLDGCGAPAGQPCEPYCPATVGADEPCLDFADWEPIDWNDPANDDTLPCGCAADYCDCG